MTIQSVYYLLLRWCVFYVVFFFFFFFFFSSRRRHTRYISVTGVQTCALPICEIGKVCPPYNIGVLHQRAAEFLLTNHRDVMRQHARVVAAERDKLFDTLSEMPHLTVYESAANMLLLCMADAEHVWRELGVRGIRVRRFAGHPRLNPYIRVTVGTPVENALFLDALREILG